MGLPSLSLSQSADVVWLAGLPPLCLTVTNNKNTHWLADSRPVSLTLGLAGWLKGPDILQSSREHRQRAVYMLCWLSAFTGLFTHVVGCTMTLYDVMYIMIYDVVKSFLQKITIWVTG